MLIELSICLDKRTIVIFDGKAHVSARIPPALLAGVLRKLKPPVSHVLLSQDLFDTLPVSMSERGRRGGKSRTARKTAAVRENGKLGGRPLGTKPGSVRWKKQQKELHNENINT